MVPKAVVDKADQLGKAPRDRDEIHVTVVLQRTRGSKNFLQLKRSRLLLYTEFNLAYPIPERRVLPARTHPLQGPGPLLEGRGQKR